MHSENPVPRKTGWGRRVLQACVGVLVACVLLLFFAWLLFPRDFARRLPERALAAAWPQWQWQVGAVRLDFPPAVRLERIEARLRANPAAVPLRVESLVIRPDLSAALRKGQWRGSFRAGFAGGTLAGEGELLSTGTTRALHAHATITALDLAQLDWLWQPLDRRVRGQLSGTVQARLALPEGGIEALQAQLRADDGEISLRQAVLGHGLLSFTELSLDLGQESGQSPLLMQGRLRSALGEGSYRGEVRPAQPFSASTLELRARIQATPELYRHVRPPQAPAPPGSQALPQQVHVLLSGTLADPALAFERGSAAFELSPQQQRPAP